MEALIESLVNDLGECTFNEDGVYAWQLSTVERGKQTNHCISVDVNKDPNGENITVATGTKQKNVDKQQLDKLLKKRVSPTKPIKQLDKLLKKKRPAPTDDDVSEQTDDVVSEPMDDVVSEPTGFASKTTPITKWGDIAKDHPRLFINMPKKKRIAYQSCKETF